MISRRWILSFSSFCFVFATCGVGFAQNTSQQLDPSQIVDAPPNEPPYVTAEPTFEGNEPGQTPLPTTSSATSSSTSSALSTSTSSSRTSAPPPKRAEVAAPRTIKNSDGSEYIEHPNAKKGLYLIDSAGVYHYKTSQKTQQSRSISLRFGNIPAPGITGSLDNGDVFDFHDMYAVDELPLVDLQYEWIPFSTMKQVYAQVGLGFASVGGVGFFRDKTLTSPPPFESFTFYMLPLNLGVSYRFQFSPHPWLVPYVQGGAFLIGLAELRDDSKRTSLTGTPAAYGAGGALINLTAWDKELQFRMDREYGIANLWLDVQYRLIQSSDQDLDFTSSYLNIGIAADY